jgi:hypothetical protein
MDRLRIAPLSVQVQLNKLTEEVVATLIDNLIGIYLHGSLVMGCFNLRLSDIDILVVTKQELSPEHKSRLATALLNISGNSQPVELSCIRITDLENWEHPCRFDFHYGDEHRPQIENCILNNRWDVGTRRRDSDLAAHVMITRHYGLALWGAPVHEVFPEISAADYWDSIYADFKWARDFVDTNPVYVILNYCRVLAFKRNELVLSKAQGGQWGLKHLPDQTHAVIRQALDIYQGNSAVTTFDPDSVRAFVSYMVEQVEK